MNGNVVDAVRRELVHRNTAEAADVARAMRDIAGLHPGDIAATSPIVQAHLTGFGPLQPLLDRPGVTDVLVNSPDDVWYDDGQGLQRADVAFDSEDTVREFAVRLASMCGRRLDDAAPWVDGHLPGRVRLHAVIPPIAVGGTKLSLRIPHTTAMTLRDLVAGGSLPPTWQPWCQRLITRRVPFIVTGGTGTGKTTLLAALLAESDPTDRIVVVEDAHELHITRPHVASLQARKKSAEGVGDVTLTDLVRQALRMRPDRLVVGECRGPEIRDLLLAANTGHDGITTTLHANSAHDVPARCVALGGLAGLSPHTVHAQVAGAFAAVIHVRRRGAMRWVGQLAAVDAPACPGEVPRVRVLQEWDPDVDDARAVSAPDERPGRVS